MENMENMENMDDNIVEFRKVTKRFLEIFNIYNRVHQNLLL